MSIVVSQLKEQLGVGEVYMEIFTVEERRVKIWCKSGGDLRLKVVRGIMTRISGPYVATSHLLRCQITKVWWNRFSVRDLAIWTQKYVLGGYQNAVIQSNDREQESVNDKYKDTRVRLVKRAGELNLD
jgi:hypothetical protein